MPLFDNYSISIISWSEGYTVNASTGNGAGINLSALQQKLIGSVSLPIIFTAIANVAIRLRRTASQPTAKANVARGQYLPANLLVPLTLEGSAHEYVSWIGATTTAGTIYIGVLDQVISDTLDNPGITPDAIT